MLRKDGALVDTNDDEISVGEFLNNIEENNESTKAAASTDNHDEHEAKPDLSFFAGNPFSWMMGGNLFPGPCYDDEFKLKVSSIKKHADGRIFVLYADETKRAAYLQVLNSSESVINPEKTPKITVGEESKQELGPTYSYSHAAMGFLKNKQQLLVLFRHKIHVWDAASGKNITEKSTFSLENTNINRIQVLEDQRHMILYHGNKPLSIWDVTGEVWKKVGEIQERSDYSRYTQHSDQFQLWTSDDSNKLLYKLTEDADNIKIWDITNKGAPSFYANLPAKAKAPKSFDDETAAIVDYKMQMLSITGNGEYVLMHFYKPNDNNDTAGFNTLWDIRTKDPQSVVTCNTGINYHAMTSFDKQMFLVFGRNDQNGPSPVIPLIWDYQNTLFPIIFRGNINTPSRSYIEDGHFFFEGGEVISQSKIDGQLFHVNNLSDMFEGFYLPTKEQRQEVEHKIGNSTNLIGPLCQIITDYLITAGGIDQYFPISIPSEKITYPLSACEDVPTEKATSAPLSSSNVTLFKNRGPSSSSSTSAPSYNNKPHP